MWFLRRNVKTDRPVLKLDYVRFGPYRIDKVVCPNAYRLDFPPGTHRSRTVHVSLLEVYKPDAIGDRLVAEPDLDDTFTVERILDSEMRDDALFYLVHWQHCPASQDSWEPANDILAAAPALVRTFHRRCPSKPSGEASEGGRVSRSQSRHRG